ncbi:hypothetical protein D3C77_257490 [compost metagenome]
MRRDLKTPDTGLSLTGQVHILGIRHLSPNGAKQVLEQLDVISPTAVLIEGPSDATAEISHLVNHATKPPVAILAFTEDLPVKTVLWPFAEYSPELQAMKWAIRHGADVSFIDLPSSVTLGLQDKLYPQENKEEKESEPAAPSNQEKHQENHLDNLDHVNNINGTDNDLLQNESNIYETIAKMAGEDSYDMYWERYFEHNLNPDAYQNAILTLSQSIRELTEDKERKEQAGNHAYNIIRESYMARQIRAAIQAGHSPDKIVVICGAYHVSALAHLTAFMTSTTESTNASAKTSYMMTDEELALLPSRPTKLTLMPYTYFKLSSMSGYGAGNIAPNYYQMMWKAMNSDSLHELPHYYLSAVAGQLRKQGTHRSTAEVIEAVRLAEALAALHGGTAPTLQDLRDASRTLLGHGDLSVVAESLAHLDVGTAIGELAEGVSQTPLQDDLNRLFKELKLDKYKTTVATNLDLDLRENRRVSSVHLAYVDLYRSTLIHRLVLLGIPFAKQQHHVQADASWKEEWIVRWTPETEIAVVESTLLGESIELACAFTLQEKLTKCNSIAEAASLIKTACLCAMTKQMESAQMTLQHLSAESRDVVQIAAASTELSTIISYSGLRQIDTAPLLPLLTQLFMRGALFLVESSTCNDEAAAQLAEAIHALNTISLDHNEHIDEGLWLAQLQELAERDDRNPKLSGLAYAILLERGLLTESRAGSEVSRRLSPGIPADLGAGWFEGLAMRNRYALLSRMSLWEQLNEYISSLDDEEFKRSLLFLRRAFSIFSPHEKNMVAEILGELWGVSTEQVAEVLTNDLKEEEQTMLDDLNDFDFEDI